MRCFAWAADSCANANDKLAHEAVFQMMRSSLHRSTLQHKPLETLVESVITASRLEGLFRTAKSFSSIQQLAPHPASHADCGDERSVPLLSSHFQMQCCSYVYATQKSKEALLGLNRALRATMQCYAPKHCWRHGVLGGQGQGHAGNALLKNVAADSPLGWVHSASCSSASTAGPNDVTKFGALNPARKLPYVQLLIQYVHNAERFHASCLFMYAHTCMHA